MAFTLKGNIFKNSASSPFFNKCLKHGYVNGKKVCIQEQKEVTSEPKPFSTDPEEKAKQLQWIKDNPEKYKEMLAEKKLLTRERDIKSGETKMYPNPFYGKKHHKGIVLDKDFAATDQVTAKAITNIFKHTKDKEGYKIYLNEHGYKVGKKKPKKVTTEDELTSWTNYK